MTESVSKELRVYKEKKRESQLDAMRECDDAFTSSIIKLQHFEELFEKIHCNAEFFIATAKDKKETEIVGYAAMYANDQETKSAYITLICVKKEYQNKQIGISLLSECFHCALENGMKLIRLEVLSGNDQAIHFYKKNGFVFEKDASPNSIYMIKKL